MIEAEGGPDGVVELPPPQPASSSADAIDSRRDNGLAVSFGMGLAY